jgi:hypothetical protein
MTDPGEFPPQAFPGAHALPPAVQRTQWAEGDIVGRDKIEGDQVGRDKITNIYEGSAYQRLDYRREIAGRLDYYLHVFVGREHDLATLARTAQVETPGYVLVEAPPGFGKSALLVQLVHLAEQGRWPTETTPRIVYFFVRESGEWNTPAAFCRAVITAAGKWCGS